MLLRPFCPIDYLEQTYRIIGTALLNFKPMDLRQVEFFLAIVDEGGVNRAAGKLFVSQSAISRKVHLLEEELGEQLFLRAGNRMNLTGAGQAFLRHARLVLRQVSLAKAEVSERAALVRGEISLGSGLTDFAYLLAPVLKKFCQRFPNVKLKITADIVANILPLIKDGRIDLAVLTGPISDKDRDLRITKLLSEELVFVVAPNHPWATRSNIQASELDKCDLITLPKGTTARTIIDRTFEEIGINPPLQMELVHFTAIRAAVEMNLGIGIVPFCLASAEAKDGRLHLLRLNEARIERELELVHLKAETLPRVVTEMIRLIRQEVGRERKMRGEVVQEIPAI
jgi:LysR family transcriptional activator of glutamate synthase operon